LALALLLGWLVPAVALPASAQKVIVAVPESEGGDESPPIDSGGAAVQLIPSRDLPSGVVDGVRVIVGDAIRPCHDAWLAPPAEQIWVCFLVTLHNNGPETRAYGPRQFSVVVDGGLARPVLEVPFGDALPSGNLPSGGAVAGVVRFQIRRDSVAHALRLEAGAGRPPESIDIPLADWVWGR